MVVVVAVVEVLLVVVVLVVVVVVGKGVVDVDKMATQDPLMSAVLGSNWHPIPLLLQLHWEQVKLLSWQHLTQHSFEKNCKIILYHFLLCWASPLEIPGKLDLRLQLDLADLGKQGCN